MYCQQVYGLDTDTWLRQMTLFNPKTSTAVQKRHPCTGNLNSETPGDSKKVFLHWGHDLNVLSTKIRT